MLHRRSRKLLGPEPAIFMGEKAMAEGEGSAEPPIETELASLARDWMTLWHSELAALAADRETQEAWRNLISLWTGAAAAFAAAAQDGAGPRDAGHGAIAAAAPRSPPAAAAPDPRDAEIERLRGRVDALERRLAELERQPRR